MIKLFLILTSGDGVFDANSPKPSAGCIIKKGTSVVLNEKIKILRKISSKEYKLFNTKYKNTQNIPIK